MRAEMDSDGKIDLETASKAAVAGTGLHMQDESRKAAKRINETLIKTEDVAIWTKEELSR